MKPLNRLALVAGIAVAALISAHTPTHARPAFATDHRPPAVIFDSDMDFDDAAALAYLAQEDRLGRIDLRAVTVANNGMGLPGKAIRHARCLLNRLGLEDVAVADGSGTAPNAFPEGLRLAVDGVLSDVFAGCTASQAPSQVRAPVLIRRILTKDPTARLVVTGPLSNVAAALPTSARRLTSMGGAIRVMGNLCCGTPPQFDGSQEFNFWIDPPAVRTVLRTNTASMALVPLDTTNNIPVHHEFLDRLRADHQTPAADLVLSIVTHPSLADLISIGGVYWWDPVAAASTVHDDLVTFETRPVDVVTHGPSAGRTVLSRTGRRVVAIGIDADAAAFEQRFLDTLNGRR